MMVSRVPRNGLKIADVLCAFVEDEALPGTGVTAAQFWAAAEAIVHDLAPRNRELLAERDRLQSRIDAFHCAVADGSADPLEYEKLLLEIGYLVAEPDDFTIDTTGIDSEIVAQPGPQLVVPIQNARFAINAANARWGSLYDALYGTDAVDRGGDLAPGESYNPARGAEVIAHGRRLLDICAPLEAGSHTDAVGYAVDPGGLAVSFADGGVVRLVQPAQFVGYRGEPPTPDAVVLVHHGLHLEIQLDRTVPIGAGDRAGVKDIVLESAVTTIMDLEDSVAAVDAEDKVLCYRNWLGLMQGTLSETVTKGDRTFLRTMEPDREYVSPSGEAVILHGRALQFARIVGHLMTTDAVVDRDNHEVGEGILDALIVTLCALHDLRRSSGVRNSRTGSIYFVKPKMHGPKEVAFTVDTFAQIEEAFNLTPNTLKLGIMDEERRTTLNLKGCIHAARERVVFINTGFLDRTGDEIHTSMLAGPVVRKAEMRSQGFLAAYETHNVDVGLASGFAGTAQIGKGMWAIPDRMADMIVQKVAQLHEGASTAWVPSPTAATLHAMHYHQVDVFTVQKELAKRKPISVEAILRPPIAHNPDWSEPERQEEVDNNAQSILGYVVRWIDQGIGCSKVPDIHDVALMEDRATLRISSQLLANWLQHGIITEADVLASLRRQAQVVDRQNAGDPGYEPLGDGTGSLAFAAARDLILLGAQQPNGYTEPILHSYRRMKKAQVPS